MSDAKAGELTPAFSACGSLLRLAAGNDPAFAGDKVVGRVILKLVAVGTLEASHRGVGDERTGAFSRHRLARQQSEAQPADFAFNQPD